MVTVVGVVGEKRAGKDTFADIFLANVSSSVRVVFSDILFETLQLWGIEPTRHNLQQLPIAMDKTFGEGSLTRAVGRRIESYSADFVVLGGIRWWSDFQLLRSFKNNKLVYVTATSEVRWQRAVNEEGKVGESQVDFDDFLASDEVETEVDIPHIGAQADITIENNGSLDGFYETCKQVVAEINSS